MKRNPTPHAPHAKTACRTPVVKAAFTPNARPAGRSRQQGSLLVLVVVALVLMALLGTAYLQVARVDRFATADTNQNDIDQVANATINYIGKVLRDDLVNNDGGFFSPTQTTVLNNYTQGTGDEDYDYPWTNALQYADKWEITLDDGTKHLAGSGSAADGGIYDDTWLASSVPTFVNGTLEASWGHVSNLMGTFLQLPALGSTTKVPAELATKATIGIWNSDTAVLVNELQTATAATFQPLGTDTDMDGVADAKWQWAPLRQIGSKKYVMAVRIIDNSAMINLNTATGITSDGNSVPATVRGYFPSEIDLSRITRRMNGTAPWQAELATNANSLFASRGVSTASPLTPLGTATINADGSVTWGVATDTATVAGAWFNNITLWGDSANKLALANEMELRRLGGVNNVNVATQIEDAMPNLLRRDATETDFTSVAYPGALTPLQQAMAFFLGVNTSDASNPDSLVDQRVFPSLRNQFTTHSATALYASNAGGANLPLVSTQYPRTLKYDLVHQDGGSVITNNSTRLTALYTRLHNIFRVSVSGSTPNSGTAYLGLDKNVAVDRRTLSDIAYEYALAIQDYSDPDRLPSSATPPATGTYTSNPTGRTYYSLETLPFFREAYVQAAYQNKDLLPAVPDGIPETFVYTPNSMALAFEIGNPFDRTINFDLAAGPAIRVKVGDNLYPLTGSLDSQQIRIYYANTVAGSRRAEGSEGTTRGDLMVDLALPAAPASQALPEGPTYITGTNIVFELQVEVAPGAWVTYDRLTPDIVGTMKYDANKALVSDGGAVAIDEYHFEIFSMRRPVSNSGSAGPYYISNFGRAPVIQLAKGDRAAFLVNSDQLGDTPKLDSGGVELNGDLSLANYQLPSANRQFMSIAELGMIQMFGFYTNAGNAGDNELGDFPSRMRDLPPVRRHLVLNDPASPTYTNMSMPHAALIFDQFTTLSPRNDGVDNDKDGVVDNEAEQVVHGQININTAPLHILTLAAPLPETLADTQALMQTIIHYRDVPGDRADLSSATTPVTRTNPGISSIGELLLMDNTINTAPPYPIDMTVARSRINPFHAAPPATFGGTPFDLYPMPERITSGSATQLQTAADGPEAKLARFQFLSQVFNTRSDTFTAYVRIRGYPSEDFSAGEVESRSFLVVYDRSNIVSASDMPRIIGVYVYNVP